VVDVVVDVELDSVGFGLNREQPAQGRHEVNFQPKPTAHGFARAEDAEIRRDCHLSAGFALQMSAIAGVIVGAIDRPRCA